MTTGAEACARDGDQPVVPAGGGRVWRGRLVPAAVAVATAVFYAGAFPPLGGSILALIFAVPFLFWCTARPSFRVVLPVAAISGALAWIFLVVWLRHAPHALDWHPLAATALGWSITALLGIVLSLFWTAWALLAWWMVPRWLGEPIHVRFAGLFGLAGAWVILEWVRTWVLTGWPWLPLAASQWQSPALLQILPYTGFHGLSFVLIFFNIAMAMYLHHLLIARPGGPWYRRFCPEFYAGLCLLLGNFGIVLGIGYFEAEREDLFTAGLVQPYIAQPEKWDPDRAAEALEILERYSTYAVALGAEVLFWPESVTPWPVKGHDRARQWTEELVDRLEVPIVMGNTAVEGDRHDPDARWYNAVFLVEPEYGLLDTQYYAKRKLVPFGEYVPLQRWLPFVTRMVPVGGFWDSGDEPVILPLQGPSGIVSIGPLICSEDLFPGLARDSVRAGAGVLFVATNNAWFGEEAGATQHAAHSVLRAVETRRPVIRSGNGGWSGWIDEFGNIRMVMLDPQRGIYFRGADVEPVSRAVAWIDRQTPYVRYGDWFVGIAGLWLGVALMALSGPRRSKREGFE